jgi:ribosome-binding ATPase YchF (GTP1/OBG family)
MNTMPNMPNMPNEPADAAHDTYINKITLEYLLNPSIHIKTVNSNELLEKDINFYKKRICQITKEMSRGEIINNNLQSIFNTYASQLIYYFKQIDYQDKHQEEYNDLTTNEKANEQPIPIMPMIKDININDPLLRNKGIKKN